MEDLIRSSNKNPKSMTQEPPFTQAPLDVFEADTEGPLKDEKDSKGIDQDLRKIFVQRPLQDLNARIATRVSQDYHRLIGIERPCRRSGEILTKSMPQEPSHKHL